MFPFLLSYDFRKCFTPTSFYLAMVCSIVVLYILYFCLLLLFHKVLPSGKLGPVKCLQCQIDWLKSTENECKDIQEVKSEIKSSAIWRSDISLVSFLLELEEVFLCIICRTIPARKPNCMQWMQQSYWLSKICKWMV